MLIDRTIVEYALADSFIIQFLIFDLVMISINFQDKYTQIHFIIQYVNSNL